MTHSLRASDASSASRGDASPGVSFVVPVYNKARELPAMLHALGQQDGDFRREFIFVDDGSTDESVAIVEEASRGWRDVRIVRQRNAGSANATNVGLAHATMPLVKFVDADDLLAPDATRRLRDALLAHPDAVLAYADRVSFRASEIPDLVPSRRPPAVDRIERPLGPAIRNSMFNPTQFLARTDICRQVGGCDERVVFSQEYSLTLRLAFRGPFVHLRQVLAYILEANDNRLSNNQARQLQRVTRALRLFCEDYPDLPAQYRRFACRRATGRAWRFARRELGAGVMSPWFRLYLLGWVSSGGNAGDLIRACERVYDHALGAGAPSVARLAG